MPLPWELPAWNAESCIASHGSSCARSMGTRGGGNRQYSGGTGLWQGMAGLHIQQSGRCHGKAGECNRRVLEPHLGGASLGGSRVHTKQRRARTVEFVRTAGGLSCVPATVRGRAPKLQRIFLTLLEPDLRPSNGTSQPPPQPVGSGRSWSVGWVTVKRGHAKARMGVRDVVPQASGSAPPKGGTRLALGCRRQTPPRGGVTAL
jgi:hypothetical protein